MNKVFYIIFTTIVILFVNFGEKILQIFLPNKSELELGMMTAIICVILGGIELVYFLFERKNLKNKSN